MTYKSHSESLLKSPQESPPAWTQEAHRLPRSKCSLCWRGWEGYPIQSWMGGTPSSLGCGGYPIQSWMGRGTPSSLGQGLPHPVLDRGVPHVMILDGGTSLSSGWGTPIQTWDGVIPIQIWDEVPPSAGWGTPIQTWDGVPPSASVDRLKILPFLILRIRALKISILNTKGNQLLRTKTWKS